MKNTLHPKWVVVISTIPSLLLLYVLYEQFRIIRPLLTPEEIQLWKKIGGGLLTLIVLQTVYAAIMMRRQQLLTVLYGILSLVGNIVFLYYYIYHHEHLISSNVPAWMIQMNILPYAGSFLMPTIGYALWIIMLYMTPDTKKHHPLASAIMAIGFPLLVYLLSQLVTPLWKWVGPDYEEYLVHVLLVSVISATLGLLLFLIRTMYIMSLQVNPAYKRFKKAGWIIVTLVLPFIGLEVNNGKQSPSPTPLLDGDAMSIFGDFSHPWFYYVMIINGLLLCLPQWSNPVYRLIVFLCRGVTFPFTLYFFAVFLPYLPLSIIAIIAYGAGFLMLSPLLLMGIHLSVLKEDYRYLRPMYTRMTLTLGVLTSIMMIPATITVVFIQHKKILHNTLEYVYEPRYDKTYSISTSSLQRILSHIILHQKAVTTDIFNQKTIPFISPYYNSLVLQNLTLSREKISTIQHLFFGKTSDPLLRTEPSVRMDSLVVVSDITYHVHFDTVHQHWVSDIALSITNTDPYESMRSFGTSFYLPDGVYITDYYLYIDGRKEKGILSEKKTALWVYNQIVHRRQDPGLLYYISPHQVALSVFPVESKETRKTGFQLIHKEPFELNIEGIKKKLGSRDIAMEEKVETSNATFIHSEVKKQLPKVTRPAYFHFMVDMSKETEGMSDSYITSIANALETYPLLARNARISWVNSVVTTESITEHLKESFNKQTHQGGFFLDRAIRRALVESHQDDHYPIIVVLTPDLPQAYINGNFMDLQFTYPEKSPYYHLQESQVWTAHDLFYRPYDSLPITGDMFAPIAVHALNISEGNTVYIPTTPEGSICYHLQTNANIKPISNNDRWAKGMENQTLIAALHLGHTRQTYIRKTIIKNSFATGLLTPLTSYIALENEAQKNVLKEKQRLMLKGNASLDHDDELFAIMSEPGLWLMGLLTVCFLLWKHRKRLPFFRKNPTIILLMSLLLYTSCTTPTGEAVKDHHHEGLLDIENIIKGHVDSTLAMLNEIEIAYEAGSTPEQLFQQYSLPLAQKERAISECLALPNKLYKEGHWKEEDYTAWFEKINITDIQSKIKHYKTWGLDFDQIPYSKQFELIQQIDVPQHGLRFFLPQDWEVFQNQNDFAVTGKGAIGSDITDIIKPDGRFDIKVSPLPSPTTTDDYYEGNLRSIHLTWPGFMIIEEKKIRLHNIEARYVIHECLINGQTMTSYQIYFTHHHHGYVFNGYIPGNDLETYRTLYHEIARSVKISEPSLQKNR
jgi:hypothetical protein